MDHVFRRRLCAGGGIRQTGRHRRELVIVDDVGMRVIDASKHSLIQDDRVQAMRRDFKAMQLALAEMSHRMRIFFGEINASDLDIPLTVNLGRLAE